MAKQQHKHNWNTEVEQELFSNLEIKYPKSKEDVWQEMENMLNQGLSVSKPESKVISLQRRKITYMSLAASVLLVLGLGLFARFYTITIQTQAGEFQSHVLPDDSEIHLNAASSLSYRPYWWSISRSISFEGEGFFEVTKGSKFQVQSKLGTTQVLGTKFNIYTRDEEYQVYCQEGKVQVSHIRGDQVVLTEGDYVALENDQLQKQKLAEENAIAWRLQKFVYNVTPLKKVFEDIERHYNVKIRLKNKKIGEKHFTGLFERSIQVEDALEIICYSFDLKFEKKANRSYLIKAN